MKKIGIIIAIAAVLAICIAAFVTFSNKQNTSEVQSVSAAQNEILTVPIKQYDEYSDVCKEETVAEAKNIISAVELKNTIAGEKFGKVFSPFAEINAKEMQTSKLYNENGCYLSACGAVFFDVASNQTSEVVQCFIFTEDFEEAGTIRFINNEIETMNISVNDSEYGGSSVILKKLAEEKDKKYILLTNGMDILLLDKENNLINAGSSRHNLEIIGDCYGVLDEKGLSMSYSDIVDEKNLIWIEFEK
ncbi:MAG: hypothetical protein NC253_14150 [Ruminococcus sp.]|nr:hypothetical protein [Ruminococcus sp.]